MRRALAACVALVLASTLVACGGSDRSADPPSLPDATLQPLRSSDRPVALRDLEGPTVINLWAQWCGPCRDELPKYQAFHEAHPDIDVLGVDWKDVQQQRAVALADKTGLTYPLVRDPDQKLGDPRGLPQLLLVDSDGKVVFSRPMEIKSVAQLEDLVRTHLKVDL